MIIQLSGKDKASAGITVLIANKDDFLDLRDSRFKDLGFEE